METAFVVLTALVLLFALLGLYDGFYLHLLKYKLYRQPESRGEHAMHTLRALLFPGILYFFYQQNEQAFSFYMGLLFVLVDVIVLGIDAYLEKDSRHFMGGLPRWEYILHLFVNGFHFAAIAVFLVIKVDLSEHAVTLRNEFAGGEAYEVFRWSVNNLLPGALMIALIHLVLMYKPVARFWDQIGNRLGCCRVAE